ncbi:MAG: aspartate-semialdehyde dehydrogenase [Bacteroidales bacterium]|nr:aspartate-semialdehyde dehydrogenase [Bacteroidales bacterium]
MNIAVVGATGLVGSLMLKVLAEQNIPYEKLYLIASQRSAGKKISFNNNIYSIITLDEALDKNIDFALFSAGKTVSLEYAPLFVKNGATVIDNSSAWRMDPTVPLVVPEINPEDIKDNRLIANPNCSTIAMIMALFNLHRRYTARRLVISTYQSVTGSGMKGINQLFDERAGKPVSNPAYPHKIDLNILPHGGAFLDYGYTEEEIKLVNETRKILHAPDIQITATVVRVPVTGGHSISLNVEFEDEFDLQDVYSILQKTEGVVIADNPKENLYPTPQMAEGKDEVFVGRIRRDFSRAHCLNLWATADNLRKGAATNAVQILKTII